MPIPVLLGGRWGEDTYSIRILTDRTDWNHLEEMPQAHKLRRHVTHLK